MQQGERRLLQSVFFISCEIFADLHGLTKYTADFPYTLWLHRNYGNGGYMMMRDKRYLWLAVLGFLLGRVFIYAANPFAIAFYWSAAKEKKEADNK